MKSIFLSIAGFNVAAGGVGTISYLLISKESRRLLDKTSVAEEKDTAIAIDSQREAEPEQSLSERVASVSDSRTQIEELDRQDQTLVDEDSEDEDYLEESEKIKELRGKLVLFKGTEEYGLGSEYSLKISYEDNSTDEVSLSFAIRDSQEALDKFLKNFNHDISFDSYDLEGFLRSFKSQEDNFKDFFGEKTYSELEAKAKELLSK